MKLTALIALCSAVCVLCGADVKLTENGKAKCSVVLRKEAGEAEKFAAGELSLYLGKISGGESPAVGTAPVAGKVPVYLELTGDPRVGPEGFRIEVKKGSVHIAGRGPVGILYGVYAVLKKYGGIRWLLPGKDGEYYKVMPTVKVPEGVTIQNPSFACRDISRVCMTWTSPIPDTMDWGMRNFMRFRENDRIIKKNLKSRKTHCVVSYIGGHCFTPLLLGHGLPKEKQLDAEKLFAKHPEYFPLLNGKRVISRDGGATSPQPCTTNPDVIRLVAQHAAELYRLSEKPVTLWFINNDTTQWCQCPRCLAVDPPAEKKDGILSTRYWTFSNQVIDRIKKLEPGLMFEGSSYQNYSPAPAGIRPDSRVTQIMISNHRRCWKHALNDPNCPTNKWYYNYNKQWNDMGVPLDTYEELSYAGYAFLPVEKCWVDTLKYYKKEMRNIAGTRTEICCPDGNYGPRFRNWKYLNNWYMMWQAMYMAMAFHWDIDSDFDGMYEEINSLYYGRGWAGGMRDFRKYLTELFMNAPGCWGYGHSVPVGKFLDVPEAKEKLRKHLDDAEKAAASDPDPRALAHVKRDREFFEKTWVRAYHDYVGNYREIKAYPLMGRIRIDGRLDEKDWKNADTVTRFKLVSDGKEARYQTAVKLAYDRENIYIGVECLEPELGRIVTNVKKNEGPVWEDNNVEILLNDPILGAAYFQIMVNAAGIVCDGQANPRFDKAWDSNMEVKTSKAGDRWFIEARIPVKSITGGVLTAGSVLKMNVMRCRSLVTSSRMNEVSTWSMGSPHSVDVFHAVSFAAPRSVSGGNRAEMDTRLWKNGSFDEPAKRLPTYKHWNIHGKKFPAFWSLSGSKNYGGDMEYLLHPGSKNNYFVRLRSGFIFNNCGLKSDKIALICRVRGKGSLAIGMLRYQNRKHKATTTLRTETINSDKWTPLKFVFSRPGDKDESQSLFLWPGKASRIDVDDLYLTPVQ